MLSKVLDFGKQLFFLMQKVEKHEEDIKDMRRDIHQLRQEVNELTRIVEHLASEMQRAWETAERDREIQRLRLENVLLRFECRLTPGSLPELDGESNH